MAQQDIKEQVLKRTFGMKEAVTITVGTVVGVGLFTTGGNVVGAMGTSVIAATLVALLISIYPALLYAEMGSALPFAGGTYKYASLGLGKPMGMLAGWNYIISLIAVTSGEALAFSFYFRTFMGAIGIELPVSDVVIGSIAVLLFTITNVTGAKITGRLQNGFIFFFWGVAIIWFIMMIPNVNLPSFVEMPGFMDIEGSSFIGYVAIIWWCYAGFETCCGMGEEIKYPHINIPRALFLAPFIVFAVNALFQWYMIGITPTDQLVAVSEASAPYAEAMITAGILGLPLILLTAGIAFGGDFSTLNASIAVPPRYLFTMARDGAMPKFFSKVHRKYKTPYVAIITLGLLTIFLTTSNSIIYIASLSLFGDLIYYVIGIIAAMGLRKKHPDLDRPYRAPGMKIGAPISAIIYVVMVLHLDSMAFISGLIWCVLGLIIFYVCQSRYGKEGDASISDMIMEREEPSDKEREKMDKEFKVWAAVVGAIAIMALVLFIVPFLVV